MIRRLDSTLAKAPRSTRDRNARYRLLILPALLAIGAAPAPAERRFMLTDFDRVRLEGPYVVEIATGKPTGAIVTGDSRAIRQVALRVDGGTLVIAPGTEGWDGWREEAGGGLLIRVGARTVRTVRINGGGQLSIDRVAGTRVDLSLAGSGQLKVGTVAAEQLLASLAGAGTLTLAGGTARTARFVTQGAGAVDAAAMSVGDLTVQSQSSGDSRFTARLTASVSALGTGAVRVAGNAVCRLSGPGPMSCATTVER